MSKDPIGLEGGINAYAYAPNPVQYLDPLGLSALEKTTTFYHAGDIKGGIDPARSRANLDFNPAGKRGFYVTTDRAQAEDWRSKKRPTITTFAVPDAELQKLNIKVFDFADSEWADFVTRGRKGTLSHGYDAVSGPMVKNPLAVKESGAYPKSSGCQMAVFSAKAISIFNASMREDC
ncbi:hypothetical protein D3C87_1505230 [compost metagenome]